MPMPEFVPTDEQRRTVRTMAGYFIKQKDIALSIGISDKTLAKYFRTELDEGLAVSNVNIGKSLYDQCVGRAAQYDAQGHLLREEVKPDKSVSIFMGKVRLGMKETSKVEAAVTLQMTELDLSVFTDDELALFMQLYTKARQRAQANAAADGEPGAEPT